VRLAIAGGGTGGHLFPALAVARLALARGSASEVVFFGAHRGIEARAVPGAGFELVCHDLRPISGRAPLAAAAALLALARAALDVRRHLRHRRISVMVGVGGYASAAGVLGARMAGVPVVLLEQNRSPGMANRVLARLAAAVCTSFEETAAELPAGKARLTGNPVRPELEAVRGHGSRDALLVFGGSAGARSLNRAVMAALAALAPRCRLPPVVHQTGDADREIVEGFYRDNDIAAEVDAFIDDMAGAYARARLAVCRAGATTVAELVATATPAVMVPYPAATSDHQRENAESLAHAGAALVVLDNADTASTLEHTLEGLLRDPDRIDSMAARAGGLGAPGAAGRVLDVIEAVVGPTP